MRKAKFSIESFGDTVFDGLTKGEEWNGWACPYFPFEEANRIVELHKTFGEKAMYDQANDQFVFEIDGEVEQYPVEFEHEKKLYPIGNSCWIWEEVGDDERFDKIGTDMA